MFHRSRSTGFRAVAALALAALVGMSPLGAQFTQPNDLEYTRRIREVLTDSRISTELVDHLPASATVPTPLKFLGRIIGEPGEITHAWKIHDYLRAVAAASGGRAKVWSIGKSEEGREMVMMAIADSATIAQLDKYKGMLKQLSDPRKTTEAQAQQLIHSAKPIYWTVSGMHSTETGGPEMLMEMAYRLVVEETPFIQNIRNNVITLITPVIEVDGRERMVDTYYWNRKNSATVGRLPLMYWGKYVQHDNNRDGMGQFLALTKHTTSAFLEWVPTVLHDLHEQQTYLYASTGEGPYNEAVDAITVDEWWLLAKNDVNEMTKRGVPGVWTYGFYDGWTPNYLFFIANARNSIGRFYEVMSYGPDNRTVSGGNAASREWFRPNPALPTIAWGPRANTNIQQSALLFALSRVARDKDLFLENYWIKNKRAVDKGRNSSIAAWVMPAGQQQRQNVAEAVNDLREQGVEFHVSGADFQAGPVQVRTGDYIIRGDQPYRTLVDMYFQVQNFSLANPSPYDDTGWTFPMMRNLVVQAVGDTGILHQKMTLVTAKVTAPGGISGNGNVVLVNQGGDNTMISLRFRFPKVTMRAAEAAFTAGGKSFNPGSYIIVGADRAQLDPVLRELGLAGTAVSAAPAVASHELTVPRIGYLHSWSSTQDEGWVRAAFDHYGVPYHYFGENLARQGNLRARYDVLVYPHGGGGGGFGAGRGGGRGGAGGAADGPAPKIPFRSSPEFPSLGYPDSTDDIGGGLGPDGIKALYEFVQQGGTLITEGGTASLVVNNGLVPGVRIDPAQSLVARGTILRGILTDKTSPLLYGIPDRDIPVYFNSSPILNVGQPAVTANPRPVQYQNTTPMASRLQMSAWDPAASGIAYGQTAPPNPAAGGRGGAGRGGQGQFGGGRGGQFGAPGRGGAGGAAPQPPEGVTLDANSAPRVVLSFPADPAEMLLSGVLSGGEVLANRAQLVDQTVGKGHIVMFAIRPFWRWQTQGTFGIGFNAIVHWNHLDAK